MTTKQMQIDFWCESEKQVGDVFATIGDLGQLAFYRVVDERSRFISREERDDCDDFFSPSGTFREVGVCEISRTEAEPCQSVASEIEIAEAKTAALSETLSAAEVVYETNPNWWLEPQRDYPPIGNCYAQYRGLGTYSWYRRVGERVQVLKVGRWEDALRDAKKNDFLRNNEHAISKDEFARRRNICERYAQIQASTREQLLAEVATIEGTVS